MATSYVHRVRPYQTPGVKIQTSAPTRRPAGSVPPSRLLEYRGALLEAGAVLIHPFVIGELALGNLRQREILLNALSDLPQASVATDAEVLHFINHNALFGRGIGYIDAHLLAAVQLTSGARLWTNDKTLHGVAEQLRLATARSLRRGS